MSGELNISLHLDKRRAKKDGTYPVKIRLYLPESRNQKYYSTGIDLSQEAFDRIFNASDLNLADQKIREKLLDKEKYAKAIAKHCLPFSTNSFEQQFYRKKLPQTIVHMLFDVKINELNSGNQISSAQSYENTMRAILAFEEHNGNLHPFELTIYDITREWLRGFDNYMQNVVGNTGTTSGIYMRNLRHILNRAVESGYLSKTNYPFGRGKYKIDQAKSKKRYISKKQINALLESEPQTPEQEKARDFWLFSYWCNGMSMQDIAQLKYEDIHADEVRFTGIRSYQGVRRKGTHHVFYLNDKSYGVITKYGNKHQFPYNYVFPVLSLKDTEEEKFVKIKRFTRFVNQHIKLLAENTDITSNISTDWARQSYLEHSNS